MRYRPGPASIAVEFRQCTLSEIGVPALRENEDHYRDLVENSHDLICTHDLNGVLLTVNLAAARTLGYEPEELANRNLRELLSPNLHKELDKYLAAVRENGAASGFMRLRTKSGETRIWRYTNTLRTEGVQVPFVRGMAHDFTDILQAQKALRESEERLRVAAEVGRMYAWEWDPATDSVRRSAECASILGLDDAAQQGVAKDYFTLVHPDDRAGLWSLANSLTPKDPAYRTQYRRFRSDGKLLWLEESGRATFDEGGRIVRLVGMTADITESKQAEENLRASEERSRQIVQRSPVAMLVTHGWEQKNELFNDKFTALFGYSIEEVPSVAQWWSLAYPDDRYRETVRAEWQMRVREAIKKGSEIEPMEATVRCKDGSYRHVEFHFASLGETNLVSFVDLTDRKNAAEALAKVGGRLIEAQEEERTRIARDLHDDIGQQLTLLAIELEKLGEMPLKSRTGVRKHISKLQKRVSEICKDIEAISHELHSSKLELLGLKAAVRSLCKEFGDYHNVKIDFDEKDVPDLLPKDISICLFRVTQEALRNGVKHSHAGRFQVQLSGTPGAVHLSVRDAGVGFDPETAMNRRGLGLISMRERINLVKGTIAIRSKPEGGTEIHCSVPLESKVTRHA
jgi:PAS domain S-box-containing protein